MPIIVTVDHARREVHAIAVGPVSYEDIERHLLQERNWKSLSYRELIDARGAGPTFAPADVRRIVEVLRNLSREAPLGRTAIVVSSDYAFGLLRMLEMLVEDVCHVRPFLDEQEARIWSATE
jgi:hypothetical protein